MLTEIELRLSADPLPPDVHALIAEAESRMDRFLQLNGKRMAAFVPSDSASIFRALAAIQSQHLSPGRSFCEWGSGFGVAAALASCLGFDACGIEIEEELVAEAEVLARDFDLSVDFALGSLVPTGAESMVEQLLSCSDDGLVWLQSDADDAYHQLGLEPDDFDLIFAYPWPSEADVIGQLFHRYAADHALLLTYSEQGSLRLLRKVP